MSILSHAAHDEDGDAINHLKAMLGRANALCRIRFMRIRELEAQLAKRKPLEFDEITALSKQAADDPDDWPEPWAFHMGVVAAERHHGIREPKK